MDLKGTKQMLDTDETSCLEESLETVLSNKSGRCAFWHFLRSEFSEDSLDFWLACRDYQRLDHPEERTQMAARIYEEFIKDGTPNQVNLDFYTRDKIRESLPQPSASCFKVAQRKVFILMENGPFSRFIQTNQYRLYTNGSFMPRDLKRHRMAVRKKLPGGEFMENRFQSGLLHLHKD